MTTQLFRLLGVVLVLAGLAYPAPGHVPAGSLRLSRLDAQVVADAPQFVQWQQRTGELPPDFGALPRNDFPAGPLTFMNGRPSGTPRTGPRDAPRNSAATSRSGRSARCRQGRRSSSTTVQSETPGNGYLTRVVAIVYGPQADKTTTVTVTLTIPQGAGRSR